MKLLYTYACHTKYSYKDTLLLYLLEDLDITFFRMTFGLKKNTQL